MSVAEKAVLAPAAGMETDVPTAVLYRVAREFELHGFKTSECPGLLSVALIRGSEESRLFVCWRNESAAQAAGHTLECRLDLGEPVWRGPVAAASIARTPLVKRVTEIVVLLAAAVGVLSAIRDYFPDFFARPEVVVRPADANPVNIVERGVLATQMAAYNEARYGSAWVSLNPPELRSDCGSGKTLAKLDLDTERIGQIIPGNSARFAVSGLAPEFPNNIPPQQLRLCIAGRADSGLVRGSQRLAASQLITVWPEVGLEKQFSSAHTIGRAVFHIYPGRSFPNGVTGAVLVRCPVKPESFSLQSDSSGRPIWAKEGGAWLSKVEFQTARLQAFVPYRNMATFRFSTPLAPEQWRSIQNSLTIEVQ